MTTLTNTEIEDFWIRCYVPTPKKLIEGSIKRAYLGLNRTLHGIKLVENQEIYTLFENCLKKLIEEITITKFESQNDFDIWHQMKCNQLLELFKSNFANPTYIGQAQKWINMTLKYLFALGEKRIPGISKNYPLFHIPIDSIIQNKLLVLGIPKVNDAWSRIDDYEKYKQYQIAIRKKFDGQIPMDVEFRLFNE